MENKKKKITMFRTGGYHAVFFYLLEKMGYEPELAPPPTDKTLSIATRYAPETLCLPHKYLLGSYIEALENKAETLLMYNAADPKRKACRGGYIGDMHRQILEDMGYRFDFVPFPFAQHAYKKLREQGYSEVEIGGMTGIFMKKILIYENIMALLLKCRPIAKKTEMADRVYLKLVNELAKKGTIDELNKLEKEVAESYASIPTNSSKDIIKIAIIGELGCVNIAFISDTIYSTLGKLGVEATITIPFSAYFMGDHSIVTKALPYINNYVGGDGQDTVGHLIDAIEKGYDGAIHITPFTCLPETIARYAMTEVGHDYDFPTLTLVLDEHTSKTGMITRIEAYVDLLRARKEKKQKELAQ